MALTVLHMWRNKEREWMNSKIILHSTDGKVTSEQIQAWSLVVCVTVTTLFTIALLPTAVSSLRFFVTLQQFVTMVD